MVVERRRTIRKIGDLPFPWRDELIALSDSPGKRIASLSVDRPDGEEPRIYWYDRNPLGPVRDEIDERWVPPSGPTKYAITELFRAVSKLYYDYYNNGWGNLGVVGPYAIALIEVWITELSILDAELCGHGGIWELVSPLKQEICRRETSDRDYKSQYDLCPQDRLEDLLDAVVILTFLYLPIVSRESIVKKLKIA